MALQCILLSLFALQASGVNRNLMVQEKHGVHKQHPFCMDGKLAPSVFFLGVQKAGTSSMWHDLVDRFPLRAAHPLELEPAFRNKEVSYFSNEHRHDKGKEFYLDHFDDCSDALQGEQSLDASPNTFFEGATAAKHIKDFYGDKAADLKFIIMVRDPARRIESAYWHFHAGLEGDFDSFVDKHLQHAKDKLSGAGDGDGQTKFFTTSLYSQHMKVWLEHFDPSQFAIVSLEQYEEQAQETMQFISKRIGLEMTNAEVDAAVHTHIREHPKMSKETLKKLSEFYEPYNTEFDALVAEKGMGFGDAGTSISKSLRFRVLEHTHEFRETSSHTRTRASLAQGEATAEAMMDPATEQELRLEYDMFSPDMEQNAPIEAFSDLYEEMHGDAQHP